MVDQVQYKVYTSWAENEKPEVRRFGVDRSVSTSFHYLNAKLQEVFPRLKNKFYSVLWKDEEGDDVIISSDEELLIALQSNVSINFGGNGLVKLYIDGKKKESTDDDFNITITAIPDCAQASLGNVPHLGVVCDGCEGPVVGFRYKCTSCDDFDLCSTCEAAKVHAEHCMVRFPVPNLPSAVIRQATKRYRHFLKTVNTSYDEGHCKKRRDRSGERKRRDHGHGHGSRHHGADGDHHRRQRVSWLEIFSNYMNEFTNLAGDVNIETENSQPKQQPQNQEQTNQNESQTPRARANTTQCPFNIENLDISNIQKLLSMYVGGMNTSTQSKPSTSNNAENTVPQQEQPVPSNSTDVEMADGETKNTEDDEESVTSAASTNYTVDTKKEESPEKGDDWTVINKENELMEACVNAKEPGPLIGFNLPKEFQERVNIIEGQSIYPPLNTATSVLNPQEAERPTVPEQPNAAPSAPVAGNAQSASAQNESGAKPKAQPRKPHPLAHIEAALEQMLAMGFSNDGGWLTQLLESKDGNIAAVLDLLTPVNPKK